MALFSYEKFCPYVGNDNPNNGITDGDVFKKGEQPPVLHKWYTEEEEIRWTPYLIGSGYFDSSPVTGEFKYYGRVSAVCLRCGAKTTSVSFTGGLTEQEKEEFHKNYTKDSFNNGEYAKSLNPPAYTNMNGFPIVNKLKNGKYIPKNFIPDYCTKSVEYDKKHKWYTNQEALEWYCEPCGNTPLVKGYCLLCNAESRILAVDYPLSERRDKDKIESWKKNYCKEKFNNGEFIN